MWKTHIMQRLTVYKLWFTAYKCVYYHFSLFMIPVHLHLFANSSQYLYTFLIAYMNRKKVRNPEAFHHISKMALWKSNDF